MKAYHKNLGECDILEADKNGITKIITRDGTIVDASTPYIVIVEDGKSDATNTGVSGSD